MRGLWQKVVVGAAIAVVLLTASGWFLLVYVLPRIPWVVVTGGQSVHIILSQGSRPQFIEVMRVFARAHDMDFSLESFPTEPAVDMLWLKRMDIGVDGSNDSRALNRYDILVHPMPYQTLDSALIARLVDELEDAVRQIPNASFRDRRDDPRIQ